MTPARRGALAILSHNIARDILTGRLTADAAAKGILGTVISPAECAWLALDITAALPDSAEIELRQAFKQLAE